VAKKKRRPATPQVHPAGRAGQPSKKKGLDLRIVAVIGVAVLGIIWAVIASNSGSGGGGVAISAEEKKYLGRLLPAGYEEPKVDELSAYTTPISMTPITPAAQGEALTFALSEVLDKRIVSFEASRSGEPLAMIAYIKPSGKLFVGVSFCPPCGGKGQRIEGDGTLTCETCGTKRNIETEVGISGACKLYPLDELPVTVAGDTVSLAQAAIDGWSEQPLDRPVGK